jgi:hypothetical protein
LLAPLDLHGCADLCQHARSFCRLLQGALVHSPDSLCHWMMRSR